MRIDPTHVVLPETVALMMQGLGTHLPRPIVLHPVPYPEEPLVRAVDQIPAIAAYEQQPRRPNYIDEYC